MVLQVLHGSSLSPEMLESFPRQCLVPRNVDVGHFCNESVGISFKYVINLTMLALSIFLMF